MTYKELIEKLKTYPATDKARFYCPVNKTYYYYVYFIDFPKYTIELTLDNTCSYDYGWIIYLLGLLNENWMQNEVKFSHNNQVFITL
jgi:hypothetical protein